MTSLNTFLLVVVELDVSPSYWLEKLALQNLEALERKIRRFKSGDMMLAGLPVPAVADNSEYWTD